MLLEHSIVSATSAVWPSDDRAPAQPDIEMRRAIVDARAGSPCTTPSSSAKDGHVCLKRRKLI
jgi:hypothetical protein